MTTATNSTLLFIPMHSVRITTTANAHVATTTIVITFQRQQQDLDGSVEGISMMMTFLHLGIGVVCIAMVSIMMMRGGGRRRGVGGVSVVFVCGQCHAPEHDPKQRVPTKRVALAEVLVKQRPNQRREG